ncbi:hypothetical protein BDV28DRAFT_109618 [Aspergillus coremiiformis]|uniref:Uncharacterized protein n=1 Tax=Aspergillus coremiiformis TaxID=138285 RepID=A0A5N6Z6L8_9EURO|nr:hypothetical protein BDV28DRAFT_109618 [Aspergillus coremiiformis]
MKMPQAYRRHLDQLNAAKTDCNLDRYLKSLTYTLAPTRSLHSWRIVSVADSVSQFVQILTLPTLIQTRSDPKLVSSRARVLFIYNRHDHWYPRLDIANQSVLYSRVTGRQCVCKVRGERIKGLVQDLQPIGPVLQSYARLC